MLKKIIVAAAATIMAMSMAVSSFAAESFTGKVTRIEGERITILVDGPVPAWARAGAVVMAEDGAPRVLRVNGSEVTLKFGKTKAAKIKPDSILTVSESTGEEVQGC